MQLATDPGLLLAMDRPVARRRPVLRIAFVAVALLTPAAAIALMVLNPAQRTLTIPAAKLTIATVASAPFHDFIQLRGQVVPLESIVLDTVQAGRVEEVLAEAGQHVTAGQHLLRLSDPALELDAIARETQVIQQIDSQRAQQLTFELTRTSDAKALADANYNVLRLARQVLRRRPLAAQGFVSREKLDEAADELAYQAQLRTIAVDALQRDAKVIKRTNELMEQTAARLDANLAAAKRQLDTLMVSAPADGVLTALDAHVGEEKVRGQHLGQIDRETGFKVTAQVDEYYVTRVRPGQRVSVTIGGVHDSLIVNKLYPQVMNGKFEVQLTWEHLPPSGLRRGQAVQGKLELGDPEPATVLPAGPFLEASGGAWVFVLDSDGAAAARRPVKLGRRTNEAVEVLSGLKPGDRVVTSDYTRLDHIDRLVITS